MRTGVLHAHLVAGLIAGCGGFLDTGGQMVGDAGGDTHADTLADVIPESVDDPTEDPLPDVVPDLPVDTAEDVEPDAPCVTAGCQVVGPASCCESLGEVNDCLPGLPCAEDLRWCISCGDGNCSPHETAFNCFVDCPEGCEVGASLSYGCTPTGTFNCTCIADPCIPYCDMMRGPQWIDPCIDAPIPGTGDPACFPFGEIHCLHVGTADEGWYDTQWDGEHVVRMGACQPRWDCEVVE